MLKNPRPQLTRPFLRPFRPALCRINKPTIQWRNASTSLGGLHKGRSLLKKVSGGVLLALGLAPFYTSHIHADAALGPQDVANDSPELTLADLIRSYVVYTMCSIPVLVDNSSRLLQLANIPGIKWVTEAFVRITFFDQFVGGDTVQNTIPLLHKLRAANKGALLVYSVEAGENGSTLAISYPKGDEKRAHKRIIDEIIHCIDVAADFEDGITGRINTGRRTWVAVKMSALVPDAHALAKFSSRILDNRPSVPPLVPFPGCPHPSDLDVLYKSVASDTRDSNLLNVEDITSLQELYSDLVRICTRAKERGVRITIDAEYSWYQPAIDALTLSLTRQFNKLPSPNNRDASNVQPLVYGTYQAYLQRTPMHLIQSLADSKANNYALGVKLVRGAYHPHELDEHKAGLVHQSSLSISPDANPPVWMTKSETDKCFDSCARILIQAVKEDVSTRHSKKMSLVPTVGVLFGTHNWSSCDLILDELLENDLAFKGPADEDPVLLPDDVTERVSIGQLYGMSDDLTDYLVRKTTSNTSLILKYLPYGALSEVMPYLSRRAVENKSVLGNGIAANQRRRVGAEIRRRIFGTW